MDVQGDTARAQWKFKRKTSAPLFHTPFEEGWAKTRFV
jgi:hypothetical protein